MEGFLNVPGARGLLAKAEIADDHALGAGQLHLSQCVGHGLVGTGVENTKVVAKFRLNGTRLLSKRSLLRNILAQAHIECKGFVEKRKSSFDRNFPFSSLQTEKNLL